MQALQRRFRYLVVQRLAAASAGGELNTLDWAFSTWRQKACKTPWHVAIEPPRGRNRADLVRYLAAYVYSVAISDRRILAVTDSAVKIATRNGASVWLHRDEFVRRWSLHVLPSGFRKVRHTGLYAPGNRALRDRAASFVRKPLPEVAPACPAPPPSTAIVPLPVVDKPRPTCDKCGGVVLTVDLAQYSFVLAALTRSQPQRGPP